MKLHALLLLFGLALPALAQDPATPAEPENAPLTVNPARDLFDLATLNYNSAREEKDPEKAKREYLSAVKTFDRFLRKFPRDPKALEAWYFLGMSYRKIGQSDASRTCFKTAATKWDTGKFVEASALFLASDDYKAEKWREAAKWFKVVAATTANEEIKHQSLYRRFLCFNKLDDKGSMVLALKTVLENKGSPYEDTARLALARLYRDTSSPREALQQFTLLATSRDQKIRSEAVLQAALTAQALGDKKLTKTWFRKALDEAGLKDVNGKTQLALMNLHYKDKEWQSVINTFRIGTFQLEKKAQLQRLIMAAKSYDALGNKKEVDKLYQKIARLSPGSASSFEAAYRILIRDHDSKSKNFPASAESFLKTYLEAKGQDPKVHSIRLLLAEHYYAAKKHKEALEHYRLLDLNLVDSSNDLGVRYHVAKTQLALKSEKGAVAAIDAFITRYPTAKQSIQLRLDRAGLFDSLGREGEAIDDYRAILRSTKDQKLTRVLTLRLAAIYQKKEDWPNFVASQEKLLLLPGLDKKTAAAANFWLGWNELRLKNTAKASPFLRQARTLDPKTFTSKVGPLLVKSAYQAEDLDLLEKETNLIRKEAPKTELPSPILRWLGATLSKDGHHNRAWPFLNEGLKDTKTPVSPLIWKLFAQSSHSLNKHRDALRAAETLLKLEKNAYRKAEALILKAQAHTGLKQFNDARQATSDALDLRPQGELNIRLRLLAGDIDIAEGKPGDAIRHYIVVDTTFAQTPADKKMAREKVLTTLKAIGTPEALEMLKSYQK